MKIPHRFYAVLFLPIKVCKCPRSCPYLRFKHKLAVKQRKLGLSDSLASNNPTSGKKFRVKSAETRGEEEGENRSRCRFVWRGLSRANTGHVSLASLLGKTKLESSSFLALFLSQTALKMKKALCTLLNKLETLHDHLFVNICFIWWCLPKKLEGGRGDAWPNRQPVDSH